MDASASSADAQAPTWKHGPQGELGLGPIRWDRFREVAMTLCAPAFILFFFFGFNWATFLIFCASIVLSVRLARFDGTAKLVRDMTMHWTGVFAAASIGLLVLRFIANSSESGLVQAAYGLGAVAYAFGAASYYDGKRLLGWEPPANQVVLPDATIPELSAMREEIEMARLSLATLPVFDDKRADLCKAWEERDPPRIAHFLQEGNVQTQDSWSRCNTMFNHAQGYIDRARRKLNVMLVETEKRLKPFNINYDAIEVEGSKQGHLETSAAIPKNLTSKRINQQNTAFIQGGARAVAQGAYGQLPPLAAVAAIGIAVAAHFIYKSRTLRKLKDVEGQLTINAKAVRGDCDMVNSIFTTRILPQFDGMLDVMRRLESGLSDLKAEGEPSPTDKDKALQVAFALVEGRRLVATAGGN